MTRRYIADRHRRIVTGGIARSGTIVASRGSGAAGIRQMPSRRTAAVAIKIDR